MKSINDVIEKSISDIKNRKIQSINQVVKSIEDLNIKKTNRVGIFYAITLSGKDFFGFHFLRDNVSTNDLGHFDHGVGIDKNTDLVYIHVLDFDPNKLNNFENLVYDDLNASCQNHKSDIIASRYSILESSKLNRKGYDLTIDHDKNEITIFKKNDKNDKIVIKNEEADEFISNCINFNISTGNRVSDETLFRAMALSHI